MKALKRIAGLTLAYMGIVMIFAIPGVMLKHQSKIPIGRGMAAFVMLGVLPLTGAILLLKHGAVDLPLARCPKCGGVEPAPAGLLTRLHSFGLMFLFGWLFAALWGASRPQQVRCVRCDTLYFTETRGSRIAGILLWVCLLLSALLSVARYFKTH